MGNSPYVRSCFIMSGIVGTGVSRVALLTTSFQWRPLQKTWYEEEKGNPKSIFTKES